MLIRRLELSDAPLLHSLRVTIDAESPGPLGSQQQRQLALDSELIRLDLSSKNNITYGAFIKRRLVGTSSIAPTQYPNWFGLYAVAVIPEFRGRKIARMLIDRCMADASARNAEGVLLAVNVPNPAAKSLYESLGFEIWNTLEHVHRYDGIQYDELTMRKSIKAQHIHDERLI